MLNKNIIIYPHLGFSREDGGVLCQYYLANVLSSLHVHVQIYNVHDNNCQNPVFNNFVSDINSVDFDNTIVIYCEGISGNPLHAKYVVRWMLSKLGQNVPYERYYTWNSNELVYFFNNEKDMIDNNIDFKILSLFYIHPEIQNYNHGRKGLCYTMRKKHLFGYDENKEKNYNELDKKNTFEIHRQHTQADYIEIFNKYKYFLSYDPLTFLSIIASMCGCVSIVYPIAGVSKQEYFKMTPFYQYMVETNVFEIYGLAYGTSNEEISYSQNTLHLVKQQMTCIQNWLLEKYVKQFIVDVSNWDTNKNILLYYKNNMLNDVHPDFDIDFYRNRYGDLKDFTNEKLIWHYINYGKNEGRFVSEKNEKHIYEANPNFDIAFYRNIHDDLISFTNEKLVWHYTNYGKNEGRCTSENHFYEVNPNFDIAFYRNAHDDLKEFTNEKLIWHYTNYGKNEGRYISEKIIHELHPDLHGDFDFFFYRNNHDDLKQFTNEQLIWHYVNYGKNEGRLVNERQFYELYPDFDIDFYRNAHDDLKQFTNEQLLNHYHYQGCLSNKKYFEYDFIVNDDYSVENQNDVIKNLVYNHTDYRTIDNYAKLTQYFKKHEKKYYIYSKESFYLYYQDFDFEYYKNRYFNNYITSSEKEILVYYHLKGKYEKHCINDKIKIIIYTPPYSNTCGGIIVMHYFAQLINEKYNDKFCAKLFMHNNLKYKNSFCNDFAKIDEIDDNTIVVYPEVVSGNPLNAKNVVRWVLLELGIEMPLDHYKKWSTSDLVYHWETNDKQLSCPFYNDIFTNTNPENRNKTCYLIKKGRLIHKNIKYLHPPDSICIDDLSLQEKAKIFNECKFFYSYDPNTAYILFSAACGCIPIIYGIEGVSEEEYFKSKIFNFDNTIYNRGIVYGNNVEKINYIIENKFNENNEEYYRNLFTMIQEKTFPPCLEHLLTIY